MVMYTMTDLQLCFRATTVKDHYEIAVFISGLVPFIAACHFIRIFNP